MKHFTFCLILICLLANATVPLSAQTKYTLSGYIEDEETGEKLIGVNIYEPKLAVGTTTNIYGFYSITLPSDSVTITMSMIGYTPVTTTLFLNKDIQLNIKLLSGVDLKEIEITSDKNNTIQENTRMSTIDVPINQIKSLPALMGEVDLMKTLQLLPGVQSGGEGSTGLYIRGGGPDQNLILLDGAPVYNASHLFGFFSVFNADAIKSVELTKGGFPARYGGRLSSVIDINMKEGNNKEFGVEGSVGLIASKLMIEGPIIKDKTSFIVTGRRTYIDLLMRPFIPEGTTFGYYFYDVNAKINHKISDNDHIYFSIYTGDDQFYAATENKYTQNNINYSEKNDFGLGWGNITSSLRWNHIINNKLFSNVNLTYSKYQFLTGVDIENTQGSSTNNFSLKYFSGIQDWSGKVNFDYVPSPNHYVKFGGAGILHTFTPGALQFKMAAANFNFDTLFTNKVGASEYSFYVEDDIRIGNRMKTNIGIHYAGFIVNQKQYFSMQPRIAARYLLNRDWAIKGSYADMTQYIHLLTNAGIGLPTDLWVPVTEKVKPQQSRQGALGVAKTIFNNAYECSIEGYYKTMTNIIEYADGASFLNPNSNWQNKIEVGNGWAYGTEFFLQKKKGKTNGWIGYTLSWNNRQFPNVNFGKVYPYKYDRRHDISIVVSHQFTDNIQLAVTWVYGTGNALTVPVANYRANNLGSQLGLAVTGNNIQLYDSKNSFRMDAYHRLDIGCNLKKKTSWGERTWNLSVYNAYSRYNPYFLYFGNDKQGNPAAFQISLFPLIPSVSYSFKF